MKPFEFMRVYHPKLGLFVDKHVGSGIIVDNIFKPMKRFLSSTAKQYIKQKGQKALKSGISKVGEKVGKKISEKSGDLIRKRLSNLKEQKSITQPVKQKMESVDAIIDRLISGSGLNRMRYIKNYVT